MCPSMVLSGVPKLANGPRGKKMEAPGLSNDRLWTPKMIKIVPQVTATNGKSIKKRPPENNLLPHISQENQNIQNNQQLANSAKQMS